MADNIAVTEGSGKDVATDDVSGKQYQRIKLDLGTDGAAAPAVAGAGAVSTGVQRITLASDDPAVAHLNNIVTSVQLIDDTVYVDDAAWTGNTSKHFLVGGLYQSSPQTVTDGRVAPIEIDVNGKIIESNSAAIAASLAIIDDWDDSDKCKVIIQTGSNAIGKLVANSGVDIGDVDITSIIPLTGATNLGKARDSALGGTDTGVMALAVRDDTLTTLTPADGDYVPLRVSSVGALHVTGGGGGTEYTEDVATANPIVGGAVMIERDDALSGLTPAEGDWASLRCDANGALWTHDDALDAAIDGSYLNVNINIAGTDVAAGSGGQNAQTQRVILATDDPAVASLGIIDDWDESNRAKVNTIAGQVGVQGAEGTITALTQRVTLATDDDAVASLGIIDDWDAAHASAASADGPQVMGAGYSTGLPTDVGADGDAARICTDRYGRVLRGIMPQWFNAIYDSADASGEGETVKAATVSRKIYIMSLTISVDAEMWVKLQDEDSNAITPKHWFKAGGGKTITYPPEAPLVLNVANKALEVITEGAGNIGVEITGYLAV